MNTHIEVDQHRCMATLGCVYALPQLFEIGEDGKAHVIGAVDGDDPLVSQIVAECPTAALQLVRSDDSRIWRTPLNDRPGGPAQTQERR
jgi:ferredoxin